MIENIEPGETELKVLFVVKSEVLVDSKVRIEERWAAYIRLDRRSILANDRRRLETCRIEVLLRPNVARQERTKILRVGPQECLIRGGSRIRSSQIAARIRLQRGSAL